jgi:hypothetical protein
MNKPASSPYWTLRASTAVASSETTGSSGSPATTIIHGDTEAKQIAAELERLEVFDAEKLFHRQIWSSDDRPGPPSRDDDA